jgi:hypothetical protein
MLMESVNTVHVSGEDGCRSHVALESEAAESCLENFPGPMKRGQDLVEGVL